MKDLLIGLALDLQSTDADLLLLQFRSSGVEIHIGFDFFSPELYLEDQEKAICYNSLLELSDLSSMITSGQSIRHLLGGSVSRYSKNCIVSLESSAYYATNYMAPLFKEDLEIVVFKNGWIHNGVIHKLN